MHVWTKVISKVRTAARPLGTRPKEARSGKGSPYPGLGALGPKRKGTESSKAQTVVAVAACAGEAAAPTVEQERPIRGPAALKRGNHGARRCRATTQDPDKPAKNMAKTAKKATNKATHTIASTLSRWAERLSLPTRRLPGE